MISSDFCAPGLRRHYELAFTSEQLPSQSDNSAMPWLMETLLRNLDFDLERVADVIDPILTASHHCQRTEGYLQGIRASDRGFLTTNLGPQGTIQATHCGARWLIGQGPHCSLSVRAKGVADYHAALSFDPHDGFCLTDLGSEEGTQVNGWPLRVDQDYLLQGGDLIQMGSLRFEFLEELCSLYSCYLTTDLPSLGDGAAG